MSTILSALSSSPPAPTGDLIAAANSGASAVAIAAFTSAFVTGLFLLGAYAYQRRAERSKSHDAIWMQVGVPVLNAADDLVARLFDVVVRQRALDMNALDIKNIDPFNPQRELSSVWRLLQYLGAAAALDRTAFAGNGVTPLETLRLYTSKARMALKGNLFRSPVKVQTEAQEAIGAKILCLGRTDRTDPTDFYEFVKQLPTDSELQDCVMYLRQVLALPATPVDVSPQLLTMAHFCLYLIDAVQDLRPTSKWEEFRVFLVALLRTHNHTTSRASAYLYQPHDLSGTSYFGTYALVGSEALPWRITPKRLSHLRRRNRVGRRARRGYDRQIVALGVKRLHHEGKSFLRYDATPEELLRLLRSNFPAAG